MKSIPWKNLFILTLLSAGLYVFMEWLFMVTKPSFMDTLHWLQKAKILGVSISLLAAFCGLLLLPVLLAGRVSRGRGVEVWLLRLGALLPAFLLAALCLLMVDNFTYTLFRFGIVSTQGVFRGLYGAAFVGLVAVWWRYVLQRLGRSAAHPPLAGRPPVFLGGLLLVVMLPATLTLAQSGLRLRTAPPADYGAAARRPHILYITADGLNATSLSVYGYERETTPNLRQLARSALVFENAFTNAGNTTGSITSIFTSKYPTQIGVLYPPNMLRGADAYQHLPGILRAQGYRTLQISFPHYVDAYTQNLINGFDQVNGRTESPNLFLASLDAVLPNDEAYFVNELYQRLADRLAHSFYGPAMPNPFAEVEGLDNGYDDARKIRRTLNQLRQSKQPLFVHIHMMGTHGGAYWPTRQVFSKGQDAKLQALWNVDFYDDSILQADRQIGTLLKGLQEAGQLEQTLLIIGSDHGKRFAATQRIPLLIRFPHQEYTGKLSVNVQNLDVAPTILDYMGLEPPEWMQGHSLLGLDDTQRPIFSTETDIRIRQRAASGVFEINWEKAGPPFYQFYVTTVVICNRWYQLNLIDYTLKSGAVEGHTAPCPDAELPSDEQAFALLVEHLHQNGFDTSSLHWPLADQ